MSMLMLMHVNLGQMLLFMHLCVNIHACLGRSHRPVALQDDTFSHVKNNRKSIQVLPVCARIGINKLVWLESRRCSLIPSWIAHTRHLDGNPALGKKLKFGDLYVCGPPAPHAYRSKSVVSRRIPASPREDGLHHTLLALTPAEQPTLRGEAAGKRSAKRDRLCRV